MKNYSFLAEDGKLRQVFKSDCPICLKRKVFKQCVLQFMTYGTKLLALAVYFLVRDFAAKSNNMDKIMENSLIQHFVN